MKTKLWKKFSAGIASALVVAMMCTNVFGAATELVIDSVTYSGGEYTVTYSAVGGAPAGDITVTAYDVNAALATSDPQIALRPSSGPIPTGDGSGLYQNETDTKMLYIDQAPAATHSTDSGKYQIKFAGDAGALYAFRIGGKDITKVGVKLYNTKKPDVPATLGAGDVVIAGGIMTITLPAATGYDVYYTTDGNAPTVASSKAVNGGTGTATIDVSTIGTTGDVTLKLLLVASNDFGDTPAAGTYNPVINNVAPVAGDNADAKDFTLVWGTSNYIKAASGTTAYTAVDVGATTLDVKVEAKIESVWTNVTDQAGGNADYYSGTAIGKADTSVDYKVTVSKNTGAKTVIEFTVDLAKPTIAITGLDSTPTIANFEGIDVDVTPTESGMTYSFEITGGSLGGPITFTSLDETAPSAADGLRNFDGAGLDNTGATTYTLTATVTRDATNDQTSLPAAKTFKFDPTSAADFTVTVDPASVGSQADNYFSSATFTFPVAPSGQVRRLYAFDDATNASNAKDALEALASVTDGGIDDIVSAYTGYVTKVVSGTAVTTPGEYHLVRFTYKSDASKVANIGRVFTIDTTTYTVANAGVTLGGTLNTETTAVTVNGINNPAYAVSWAADGLVDWTVTVATTGANTGKLSGYTDGAQTGTSITIDNALASGETATVTVTVTGVPKNGNPASVSNTYTLNFVQKVSGPAWDIGKAGAKSKFMTTPGAGAFGISGTKRVFLKLETSQGANPTWKPTAKGGVNAVIFYSTERAGYDAVVYTAETDLATIANMFDWVEDAANVPKLLKYGTLTGTTNLAASDINRIKQLNTRQAQYAFANNIEQAMKLDTEGNSNIGAATINRLKQINTRQAQYINSAPIIQDGKD